VACWVGGFDGWELAQLYPISADQIQFNSPQSPWFKLLNYAIKIIAARACYMRLMAIIDAKIRG
jgi:hypothetical protein